MCATPEAMLARTYEKGQLRHSRNDSGIFGSKSEVKILVEHMSISRLPCRPNREQFVRIDNLTRPRAGLRRRLGHELCDGQNGWLHRGDLAVLEEEEYCNITG